MVLPRAGEDGGCRMEEAGGVGGNVPGCERLQASHHRRTTAAAGEPHWAQPSPQTVIIAAIISLAVVIIGRLL